MMNHKLTVLCSISALVLATACSSTPPPRSETASRPVPAASNSYYSQMGYVSNIELVPVASRTSGGGAVIGAVLGAVIGNQVGGGTGRAVATGVGAVGGGVIGNEIEKRNKSDNEVYRVSVRYDNGQVQQFDYQRIDDLRVGDRVKVEGGQLHRV